MSIHKSTAVFLILIIAVSAAVIVAVRMANYVPTPPAMVYDPTAPLANKKVVCIVFDDGWKSQLEAVSILQTHNFNATFAIITSYSSYPDYMTWSDIAGLARNGMDIASHTQTHSSLASLDNKTLYDELEGSQRTLRSRGYGADVFVYPYGEAASNQTVRNVVAQYYLVARGTDDGKCNLTNPATLDRYNINAYGIYNYTTLQDFASYLNGTEGSAVTVLYYHQIGYENAEDIITKESFQAQMQYLKDNGYTTQTLSQLFLKQATQNP